MNKYIFLALLLVTATSLRVDSHQEQLEEIPPTVGGWSSNDPAKANTEIDEYIREQYPSLKDAKLIAVKSQVVSGMNYQYTYELSDKLNYTVTVWEQSWLDRRQVTGLQKIEEKINSKGQKVRVTTTTRIEEQPFEEVTQSLFS